MDAPIEVRLRNERQVALSRLQDVLVEALFEIEPRLVLHGGTAIWRCYSGNRFSEDVDLYATDAQMIKVNNELTWALSKRDAKMEYPIHTNRVIQVFNSDARARLEAMNLPRGMKPVQMEYSRANGSRFFVNTLSLDDFIAEKARTYGKRGYVRDLYDIYHLTSLRNPSNRAKQVLRTFLEGIKKPTDTQKLQDLVYSGVAPSFETMVEEINVKIK